MTQEAVADLLGVSSQSVSKWERGIIAPGIHLLPKIALLYKTSIDSIFDMELYWGEQHRVDFENKIKTLKEANDKNGIFFAYINEIRLMPDSFELYTEIMLLVLKNKMKDDEYVSPLIKLTDYADAHCHSDDIRNEIHRLMLQICSLSDNSEYSRRVKEYYLRLSMLRHSREVYAKYVLSGEEYTEQLKANAAYTVDIAECAIRQMITVDMSPTEKLFYYKKAAALYEVICDGKYTGFYDVPLMCDYANIAKLLYEMGYKEEAEAYTDKILVIMGRFTDTEKQNEVSALVPLTHLENRTAPKKSACRLIEDMLKCDAFKNREKILTELLRNCEF